jgi:Holliday junction resolvase RusA-like endonuclease
VIIVELPGEPEGRKQPQPRIAWKDGRQIVLIHPASETRKYQKALAWQAKAAMRGRPLLTGPVALTVTAVMGVPKSWSKRDRDAALTGVIRPTGKPDWDNVGKQADAFKDVVWVDDAIVVDCHVVKVYGENPMLRFEVRQIDATGGLL